MENTFNLIDNFHQYWWILLVIGIFLFWVLIEYLWKLAKKHSFKECPRCETQLLARKVYHDHCDLCFDTSAEQLKQIYGDGMVVHDTGYEH